MLQARRANTKLRTQCNWIYNCVIINIIYIKINAETFIKRRIMYRWIFLERSQDFKPLQPNKYVYVLILQKTVIRTNHTYNLRTRDSLRHLFKNTNILFIANISMKMYVNITQIKKKLIIIIIRATKMSLLFLTLD